MSLPLNRDRTATNIKDKDTGFPIKAVGNDKETAGMARLRKKRKRGHEPTASRVKARDMPDAV